MSRRVATAALTTALLLAASAGLVSAEVPSPTLEGPVTGGSGSPFVAGTTFDLASVGYTQAEYFITGTATAYANGGPFGAGGRWAVVPGAQAAYRTRILVYRPIDRRKFNGTVVVEWLNVSSGLDSAPDWINAHTELTREGYAWVGVSAQRVGIEGGFALLPVLDLPLKKADPVRYASLVHPGDSFSYDIFSQAGQALRRPAGENPLGDLRIRRLIAAGESQSAFRMVTYVNAVHPVAGIYDGFLVHSRGAGAAALSEAPQPAIAVPRPAPIRDDIDVPVLTFETETDLMLLGYAAERQPDHEHFRLWEVAGTAHADTYTLVTGSTDVGRSPAVADLIVSATPLPYFTCGAPVNSGPQHFVLNAAVAALDRWVRRATPPPSAPRLEVAMTPAPVLVRDADGNASGGVRTPQLDVPIATLSGEGQSGSLACLLFGTTVPFDAPHLDALYPSHRAYVAAFRQAARRAVRAGHVRPRDARLMRASAAASSIGR